MTTIDQSRSSSWTGPSGLTTNGESRVLTKGEKPLPGNLIAEYARRAVRGATLEQREDGSWFAQIPGFEGVWASEASHKEALDALQEVVFDWAIIKIQHEDRDLPIIDGIDDLNEL